MARLKIVGRDWENIPQSMAEKIAGWKADPGYSPQKVVDLAWLGAVELGQIKQVVPDDPSALKQIDEEKAKADRRKLQDDEYSMMIAAYRLQPPEDKAKRIASTWAQLLWTYRGNWTEEETRLPDDLKAKVVERLIPYFRDNPSEWTCGSKEYDDLIPYGERYSVRKGSGSMTSIGQTIQSRGI